MNNLQNKTRDELIVILENLHYELYKRTYVYEKITETGEVEQVIDFVDPLLDSMIDQAEKDMG